MSKEKFLRELEKKLAILSEEERKDIINEHRDIIEEKMKHGKTEEEAVSELGSVESLAKEILNAYKINPDYNRSETKEKTKQIVDDCEDLIKKGARKLSDVTEEVMDSFKASGKDFNLENVFEIVIKVFLVLLLLAVLRIPFAIVGSIGSNIFDGSFPFFGNWVFQAIWHLIIGVVYIAVCFLIVLSFANQYTRGNNTTKGKKPTSKKQETVNEKKENKTAGVKVERSRNQQPRKDNVSEIILLLVKIFVVFVILLPLWAAIFGLIAAISVMIWLLIKGVAIYGVLILLIGVMGMFTWIADLIYNALFKNRTPHVWTITLPFIMIIIGGIMSIDYFSNFTYIDKLPNEYELATEVYVETITEKTRVQADEKTFIIDPELNDNQVKIEAEYYDKYMTIRKNTYSTNVNNIVFYGDGKSHSIFSGDTKLFIDQLKLQKWYPYHELGQIHVTIYTNENTRDLVS